MGAKKKRKDEQINQKQDGKKSIGKDERKRRKVKRNELDDKARRGDCERVAWRVGYKVFSAWYEVWAGQCGLCGYNGLIAQCRGHHSAVQY